MPIHTKSERRKKGLKRGSGGRIVKTRSSKKAARKTARTK